MKSGSFRGTLLATSATMIVAGSAMMMLARTAYADTPRQESAGELLDDAVITARVKAALVQDETVSALRIKVTSNNGTVQLSGFANSLREVDRAAEIARGVPGVKDVSNDILLKQTSR
ncbi:MAG: BON domain-containing protein [Sulfuritalea sp.]|nr:BON domain-containing protein [Sulfuritalea sp.]